MNSTQTVDLISVDASKVQTVISLTNYMFIYNEKQF